MYQMALIVLGVFACMNPAQARYPAPSIASCKMVRNCGRDKCVSGVLFFTQKSPKQPVLITGALSNVVPNGKHGWHVHEFPIRDPAVGCDSAGPHFNPFGVTHGDPVLNTQGRHVGDLGNIVSSGYNGNVFLKVSDPVITLFGPPGKSIRGRTLVIHLNEDDLGTGVGAAREGSLATGNAGARIGCCEIRG